MAIMVIQSVFGGSLTLLISYTVMMIIPTNSLDLWNWRDTSSSESQQVTSDSDENVQIDVVRSQNWNIPNLDLWNVRQPWMPTNDGIDKEDPRRSDIDESNMHTEEYVVGDEQIFPDSNLRSSWRDSSVLLSDVNDIGQKSLEPDVSDQTKAVSENWSILNLIWQNTKATGDNDDSEKHKQSELNDGLQTEVVNGKWSLLALNLWNWRDARTPTTAKEKAIEQITQDYQEMVVHEKIVAKEWSLLGRDITKDLNVKLDVEKIRLAYMLYCI